MAIYAAVKWFGVKENRKSFWMQVKAWALLALYALLVLVARLLTSLILIGLCPVFVLFNLIWGGKRTGVFMEYFADILKKKSL